jgi:hypothetical protein
MKYRSQKRNILERIAEEKKIVGTVASNTCHFYLRPRKDEGTNAQRHERANLTTPIIASVAKQPSLQARRSLSRAFAKTMRFFPDCFVAALLAMTLPCFLCGVSWLRTSHFQFSIFNFQLLKFSINKDKPEFSRKSGHKE